MRRLQSPDLIVMDTVAIALSAIALVGMGIASLIMVWTDPDQ